MSTIKVSAFRWVPPFAQGVVRDVRVRWALEEAGLPYEQRLLDQGEQKSAGYRSLQPFGQVPTYEEGNLVLFESGAIVMHIAARSEALLPADPAAAARARTWMFAALNTVEPYIQHLAELDLFYANEEWAKLRRPTAVEAVQMRLNELSTRLDGRDYLEDRFTAGDLLMTTVLRILRHTDLVAEMPALEAYRLRCEARPAFQKALADHMEAFG
ncbi:MAG TPA: glutathione S-transferase family protein [Candidatus Binatia bacterium]|jgi:glutathione S-transferase|nr:glutathione S-transferase family protein [Candidatus Binatia bacterium]